MLGLIDKLLLEHEGLPHVLVILVSVDFGLGLDKYVQMTYFNILRVIKSIKSCPEVVFNAVVDLVA